MKEVACVQQPNSEAIEALQSLIWLRNLTSLCNCLQYSTISAV